MDWLDVYKKLHILLGIGVGKMFPQEFHKIIFMLFEKASQDLHTQMLKSSRMEEETTSGEKHKGRVFVDEHVLKICLLLIAHGTDLSARGILICAVRYGSLDCIQTLLENGVVIEDSDEEFNTALHHCFRVDSKTIIVDTQRGN